MIYFSLFCISFIANMLAALSGGGAGFIQFPILIFMGLSFGLALGTHKVAVVALGASAIFKKRKQLKTLKEIAIIMSFIGCPSVIIGSILIINVPSVISKIFLGLLTIGLAIYTIVKRDFGLENKGLPSNIREWIIGSISVAIIGILNGSFSSGTGLFATMCLIKFFGLNIKDAILQSLIWVGGLWNLVGALTLGTFGQINWDWEPPLIAGAFIGGYVGIIIGSKLKLKWIKMLFIGVSIVSGLLLLVSAIFEFLSST